jgi:pantoate--beta-alanine ligase
VTALVETIEGWRDERRAQLRNGLTLGFVPTMGALHEGHLSLVRRSRAENDRTVVSIFVNPTQFDDASDFAQYPRAVAQDVAALEGERVDFVFVPSPDALYPDRYRYRVTETAFSADLEGASRPGHFDGVLTVVLKLLQIVGADRAYFGEKDWQQLRLVQGMVDAFFLPTRIVACPTERAPDGLALSSRNVRLTPADRHKAPLLHRVLQSAASRSAAAEALTDAGFDVDYVEEREGRRLAAVRLGGIRLIDNVPLGGAR